MLLEQTKYLKKIDRKFSPHIISIHKVSFVLYVYMNKNVEHFENAINHSNGCLVKMSTYKHLN